VVSGTLFGALWVLPSNACQGSSEGKGWDESGSMFLEAVFGRFETEVGTLDSGDGTRRLSAKKDLAVNFWVLRLHRQCALL
jgi:hypothetical protein